VAWFELWAPDLDGMLQRARELGAVVELHRTNLPSGNAMAIIRDAGGNRLGLWAS
jgi:predicted enzyme related to lactoylglutathione lyase